MNVTTYVQELTEKSAQWTERFATDFEAKDAELKALTATRERDLERLHELQARFDRDLADRAAREVRHWAACAMCIAHVVEVDV